MKIFDRLSNWIQWLASENATDFKENKKMVYESIVRTNTAMNQIILTVSLAGLATIAALHKPLFDNHKLLSFIVLAIFITVILLSIINLFLSMLALRDIQKKLIDNWKNLRRQNYDMKKVRFSKSQSILDCFVFFGFCIGLVALIALLGIYILGVSA